MTTYKEYKAMRDDQEVFGPYDYLNREETNDLMKHMREQKRKGKKMIYDRAYTEQDGKEQTLVSYYTEVAKIGEDEKGLYFVRLWGYFSKTTLKHVNKFREMNGFPGLSKREWIETPTNRKERLK